MKQRFIPTIAVLACLIVALMTGAPSISAQQPTPAPSAPVPSPTPNLEHRIDQLEIAQSQTIASLKSSNDYNQFLITVIGGLIALLVAIQGFTTAVQLRREGKRDKREAGREDKRDLTELAGVEQVSKIMAVVQQTLEGRRLAEEKAREEAAKAQEQLEKVLGEVKAIDRFFKNFQTNIQKTREALEETASRWAREVARHDFRRMTDELNDFARRFDQFKADSEPLEEETRTFTARVPYIRGIAAHYANQPEETKRFLTEVVGVQVSEIGETEIAFNRRTANAYYYLGLTESNFGNSQNAIEYFENANKRDLQGRDFLTRIVTAEAYVMINEFDKASQFITEVEDRLQGIEQREGHLQNFHLRLRSRAALVKANMVMLGRQSDWHAEVKQILEPVHLADPQYYYATVTLAQVQLAPGVTDDAHKLFREAHDAIVSSDDLHTVKEARSQILLLMEAAMCAKHGLLEDKRAEDYLDQADSLRSGLPTIGPQVCTVFSVLSKHNENSETIHYHIQLIRAGQVLL
jgi:tetratricopeptide (TPR) repeat protein